MDMMRAEASKESGAISHLTISVGSEVLYPLALDFYKKIGFKVVSQKLTKFDSWLFFPSPDPSDNAGIVPTSGFETSEDFTRSGSLGTTSLSAIHGIAKGNIHNEVLDKYNCVFRIVLSKGNPIKTLDEAREIASVVSSENCDRCPMVCLIASTNQLHVITEFLKDRNWPYLSRESNPPFIRNKLYSTCQDRNVKDFPSGCKSIVIHTSDPGGNWIAFTNRLSPFDGEVMHPPLFGVGKAIEEPPVCAQSDSTSSVVAKAHLDNDPNSISIAILTSGGDSSGMNAALRACVRTALQTKHIPYIVYGGYKGLVSGGDDIVRAGWDNVRALQSIGGTCIGTARCKEFFSRKGRLLAAKNLFEKGITSLVVIGGDGSLTGANILRTEWKSLLKELHDQGDISKDIDLETIQEPRIVGLVGSIDNDMLCTDYTIGAYTSLHRICEALDALTSTALSHKRAFVVEVMGRRCGWLGLMTAVAIGAHYVFIPERPPPFNRSKYGKDWKSELCDSVIESRKSNNYRTLLILSEGAVDLDLNPITPSDVADALSTRIGVDTRFTCLGHVQRGGKPCAYDRYLATIQGVKAIDIISNVEDNNCSYMVGIRQNKLVQVDLIDAVEKTKNVANLMKDKNFDAVFKSRGEHFSKMFTLFTLTSRSDNILCEGSLIKEPGEAYRVGIVTIGAPAGGTNAAVRSVARLVLKRGWVPLAIKNGMYGLSKGHVSEINWSETIGMQVKGGSVLGTSRIHPRPLHDSPKVYPNTKVFVECGMIAYNMTKLNINALIIIGGFEAVTSQLILTDARRVYPAFRIPIICIPATVSNNIPGTEYTIGCDTALNVVVEACDRIKMSADATKERLYIIEVQGKNCGYLAAAAGLTSGASRAYIPEIGVTLKKLCNDFDFIKRISLASCMTEESSGSGRIVLISDGTSKTYTSSFICQVFQEYLEGALDVKPIVLGHLQQGGNPSPFDRLLATLMTYDAVEWICDSITKCAKCDVESFPGYQFSSVVGSNNSSCRVTNIYDIVEQADVKARRPKHAWWINLYNLISSLNRYSHDDYSTIKKSPSGRLY